MRVVSKEAPQNELLIACGHKKYPVPVGKFEVSLVHFELVDDPQFVPVSAEVQQYPVATDEVISLQYLFALFATQVTQSATEVIVVERFLFLNFLSSACKNKLPTSISC